MTNENHFNHNSFRLEQATENKLDFENWMFNDVLFTGIQETENPLTIENWMISEQVWK
jgi:hypothetical protein